MTNIKELIDDTTKLNALTLPELKTLVDKYPFFQAARLLYLSNLYKLHSKEFGAELRKASVFVPDRTALFALTESVNYELPTSDYGNNIETESDSDRTTSLIENFLGGIETSEDHGPSRNKPSVADLTTDYASFLMQQDTPKEGRSHKSAYSNNEPKLKGGELIDKFIKETQGKQRLEMPETSEQEFESPELSDEDEEIYTESMVNIYIKQSRYQQALEILRKICLNNPKKSSNFAAQINLLEIILNEKK